MLFLLAVSVEELKEFAEYMTPKHRTLLCSLGSALVCLWVGVRVLLKSGHPIFFRVVLCMPR